MIEVVRPMAIKGHSDFQLRLGRAYREGRGVPKDIEQALKWMRLSSNQGFLRAKHELCDLLWSINSEKSLRLKLGVAVHDIPSK